MKRIELDAQQFHALWRPISCAAWSIGDLARYPEYGATLKITAFLFASATDALSLLDHAETLKRHSDLDWYRWRDYAENPAIYAVVDGVLKELTTDERDALPGDTPTLFISMQTVDATNCEKIKFVSPGKIRG